MIRTCARFLLCLLLVPGALRAEQTTPYAQLCPLVGTYLERDYYDAKRFDPPTMLAEAMRALESSHVAIDAEFSEQQLILHLGSEVATIPLPAPSRLVTIDSAMEVLQKVQEHLLSSSLLEGDEGDNLVYTMLNGALRTLDPHTVVLPPEPAKAFSEDVIAGEFFGIGAYLSMTEGLITIDRVMPGLPADIAGVKDDDVVLAIDGETAAGLSLSEAVRRIKGPKGTTVQLLIERGEDHRQVTIPVVRDKVQPIIIASSRRGPIGYIRMDEFSGHTYRELRLHIQQLKYQSDEPMLGLVLDLRQNGGGRLDQAVYTADLFLPPRREVVRTVRLNSKMQQRLTDRSQMTDVPMLVLVSGGSASAAEILSGALQRNERAVVIGQTTFGKGSVQTWRKLPDASYIKYTIQEYQLRDGVSIQGRGVQPDIELHRHAQRDDGGIDLIPFTRHQEADEEFALIGDGSYDHTTSYQLNWFQAWQEDEELEQYRISHPQFQPDQEANLAVQLLGKTLAPLAASNGGQPIRLNRQQLLDAMADPLAAQQRLENQSLAQAFVDENKGVVWNGSGSPVPSPEDLSLSLLQDKRITAGTDIELQLQVDNHSDQVAARLYGVIEADGNSPYWESEVVFGDVPGGACRTGLLSLSVPPRAYPGLEYFDVVLHQSGTDAELARLPVQLTIDGQARPELNYAWSLPGAQQWETDREHDLQLTIQNQGAGSSAPLVLFVRKEDDPFIQLGAARWRLDSLPPGGETSISIPVTMLSELTIGNQTKRNDQDQLHLTVHVEERFESGTSHYLAERLTHKLKIPVNETLHGDHIHQPQIHIESQDRSSDGMLELRTRIDDDNAVHLAIFVGEDKLVMRLLDQNQDSQSFADLLPLQEGMNDIRIVVEDADGINRLRLLRVWSDQGATPAVVKAPGPSVEMP